jgi:hypothetical protein
MQLPRREIFLDALPPDTKPNIIVEVATTSSKNQDRGERSSGNEEKKSTSILFSES